MSTLYDSLFHSTLYRQKFRVGRWLGSLLILCLAVGLSAPDVHAQEDPGDSRNQIGEEELLEAPDLPQHYDRPSEVSPKHPVRSATVFSEDFETSDTSNWNAEGVWEFGEPNSGPNGGFNSPNAAATNLSGAYSNSADDRVTSPSITLPDSSTLGSKEELVLFFDEWFEIQSCCDDAIVEISTDGGSSWSQLGTRAGIDSTWREAQFNLTQYAGEDVQLGFRLSTSSFTTYDGWYVDNVEIARTSPEPLDAHIASIDAGSFPFIFMNVTVSEDGEAAPGLDNSNFTVLENGTVQTDFFNVTPPDTSGNRLLDIVFLMDNSGSMSDEQEAVENNVFSFVDSLEQAGANYALGLTRFGASENSGNPVLEDNGSLTTDEQYFRDDLWQRNTIDGSFEPGWDALYESATDFNFRQGSRKVFVLITDERAGGSNAGDRTETEAQNRLISNSITTFALIDSSDADQRDDYGDIADATGGQIFDVFSPFEPILDRIGEQVANTYIVRYRTQADSADGVQRNVELQASYNGKTDTASTTYTPGASPEIDRTAATVALSDTGQSSSSDITIEAEITDREAPDVQRARLYYRTTGDQLYTEVEMAPTSAGSDVYEGTIPASDVSNPGMDYYISATDGVTTTTSPNNTAASDPWQFAVLPNQPPSTNHTPISSISPGQSVEVSASVSDNGGVDSVRVFFRQFGNLLYQGVGMTPSQNGGSGNAKNNGTTYTAEIPESAVTSNGIEYYVEAEDDTGVRSLQGNRDEPNRVVFPTPPLELRSEVQNLETTLDWPAPSETGLEKYLIYRDRSPIDTSTAGPSDLAPIDSVSTPDTSYTDTDAEPGYTYYYRVTAVDTTGNESAVSPQRYRFLYPQNVSAEVSRSFDDASGPDDYRLVSLPGAVNRPLADGIEGEPDADWQAYWDDGSSFVRHDGSETFNFSEGQGFWLTSTQDWTVNEDIETVSLEGDTVATIDLHDGWNIISNPLDKDVEWSFVEEFNDASLQPLWSFDGGFSQTSTFHTAASGEAFYFLNDDGLDELTIPYPDAPFAGHAETKSKEQGTESVIKLVAQRLDAEGTVNATSEIQVGFHENAERGRDAFDAVAPPSDFSSVSLRIDDGQQVEDPRQRLLTADHRPPTQEGHTFDLRLTATGNAPVQLTAYGDFEGEVALLRPSDGTSYELTADEPIELRPSQENTRLQLAVGSKAFVDGQKDQLLPKEVTLTSYPNPFRQQATVEYTLPEAADVRLVVYDVLGREVAELANGRKEAGHHHVRLQGHNLSSGVYFGRLEVGDQRHTQKITVVR